MSHTWAWSERQHCFVMVVIKPKVKSRRRYRRPLLRNTPRLMALATAAKLHREELRQQIAAYPRKHVEVIR